MIDDTIYEYLKDCLLFDRCLNLNHSFEWTPEKVEYVKKLGVAIVEKEDLLIKKVKKLAEDYNKLFKETDTGFEDFYIEGCLRLKQNIKLPFASLEDKMRIWYKTFWEDSSVSANTDGLFRDTDDGLFLRDMNWNIERFDKKYVGDTAIPYFLHRIFVDADTYSLEDLMRISPDDFIIDIVVIFRNYPDH